MREEVWIPLIGLLITATVITGTVAAIAHMPGKIHPWIVWGGSVLSGICYLSAGVIATNDTWIEDLVVWIIGWHPIFQIAAILLLCYGTWKAAMAAFPDEYVTMTASSGILVMVFFLPILVQNLPLKGDIPDLARDAVRHASKFSTDLTDSWFT